jgi:hypothetical protein
MKLAMKFFTDNPLPALGLANFLAPSPANPVNFSVDAFPQRPLAAYVISMNDCPDKKRFVTTAIAHLLRLLPLMAIVAAFTTGAPAAFNHQLRVLPPKITPRICKK